MASKPTDAAGLVTLLGEAFESGGDLYRWLIDLDSYKPIVARDLGPPDGHLGKGQYVSLAVELLARHGYIDEHFFVALLARRDAGSQEWCKRVYRVAQRMGFTLPAARAPSQSGGPTGGRRGLGFAHLGSLMLGSVMATVLLLSFPHLRALRERPVEAGESAQGSGEPPTPPPEEEVEPPADDAQKFDREGSDRKRKQKRGNTRDRGVVAVVPPSDVPAPLAGPVHVDQELAPREVVAFSPLGSLAGTVGAPPCAASGATTALAVPGPLAGDEPTTGPEPDVRPLSARTYRQFAKELEVPLSDCLGKVGFAGEVVSARLVATPSTRADGRPAWAFVPDRELISDPYGGLFSCVEWVLAAYRFTSAGGGSPPADINLHGGCPPGRRPRCELDIKRADH